MLVLASCTSFEPERAGVSIRVLNNSDHLMRDVHIGGNSFGDVEKNELTDFIQTEQIYSTINVHLEFADHSFDFIPIDHVGETPMRTGAFTFIISAEDEYGSVYFNMVEGNPPAGDEQPRNAERVLETRESYSAVSAVELEDGAIVIAGNKETIRFINPTISNAPGSSVRYFQDARSFVKSNEEWLIKTDALGNLIWSKPLEAIFEMEFSKKLLETPDGGFLIAGATTIFNEKDKVKWGVHLINVNADGRVDWTKTFAPGDFTVLSDIKPTGDGGYILSGAQEGQTWLMKVTSNGDEVWQKTLRSSFPAESALPADNGYFVAGGRYGDHGSSPGGVSKTDLSGREIWSVEYDAELWAISGITSDAVFVSGTSDRKAIALKLDTSGNEEWMMEYSAFNKGGMHVVSVDSLFVIAGQIDRKPAILYVSKEGELIWSRQFSVYPLWKPNTEDVLVSTADGHVVFIGNTVDSRGEGIYMAKVDLNGNVLFERSFFGDL